MSAAAHQDCSFVDNLKKFEISELYLREEYFEVSLDESVRSNYSP